MFFLAFGGPMELGVVFLIVVLLFGAKKLPGLARAMGSSINQFKQGLADEQDKQEQLTEADKDQDQDKA